MLLLTVVAGVAASLWQAQVARANAARADAVKDFMVQIFKASVPDVAAGKDPPASELLRRGAERVRQQFADQPALLAQMLTVIGTTQQQRGLLSYAEASLDSALEAFSRFREPSVDHARALKARANLHYDRGELDDAMTGLRQADRVAAAAGLAPLHELRAETLVDETSIELEKGDGGKAAARLKQFLSALRAHGATGTYVHAHALQNLGAALDSDDKPQQAIPYLRKALDMVKSVRDEHPTLMCDALNDLGIALFDAGYLEQGLERTRQTIECAHRYYGDYHQTTLAAVVNLAWLLASAGHPDEAAYQYARMLPAVRITNGARPSVDMAFDLGLMALARDEAGRDDALDAMQAALHEAGQLEAADTPSVDWIEPIYGLLLFERNLPGAAGHMGDYPDICNTLETLPRSHQRLCIARLLVASEAGHCLLKSEADPGAQMSSAQQRPWLAGYWLVRQRCAREPLEKHRAAQRLQQTLDRVPVLPPWLQARLPQPAKSRTKTGTSSAGSGRA